MFNILRNKIHEKPTFISQYAWTHMYGKKQYTAYCLHTSLSCRRVSRIWSKFFFIDHNYFLEAQRNVFNLLLFLYKVYESFHIDLGKKKDHQN